jgi:flagellar biosynthesis/type III secretory pathway protein FliH
MTPIDTIISYFEAQARYYRDASKQYEVESIEEGYALGKANGFQEAANFLKGLQELFR